MPLYTFRFEMACNEWGADNQAWAIFRQLEMIVEKSTIQFNLSSLLKDGKDYPRSLKEYEDREKYEKRKLLEVAKARATDLETELESVRKVINELS